MYVTIISATVPKPEPIRATPDASSPKKLPTASFGAEFVAGASLIGELSISAGLRVQVRDGREGPSRSVFIDVSLSERGAVGRGAMAQIGIGLFCEVGSNDPIADTGVSPRFQSLHNVTTVQSPIGEVIYDAATGDSVFKLTTPEAIAGVNLGGSKYELEASIDSLSQNIITEWLRFNPWIGLIAPIVRQPLQLWRQDDDRPSSDSRGNGDADLGE